MNITRKDVISYAVLPQILPRIKALLASGFHYVPYLIALVYSTVRLIPGNHSYLDPANMGRFGVRHVVAEAANNLTVSWKNADQVVLFVVVLAGLAMTFMQVILLGSMLFMQSAFAANFPPQNFADFFVTPNPEQDVAHIMLDMVFGVPGIFDSCVAAGNCLDAKGQLIQNNFGFSWGYQPGAFPNAIHEGLHTLFQIYSLGLLVIATFIAAYFMTTVVAETMQSGTAFGKRYNKVWAPVRMVVAFGLLVPITYGLNSSQYIVLYAAKYGSAFATNGWIGFNSELNGGAARNLTASPDASTAQGLIATPKRPELAGLLSFLYVARTCYEAEQNLYGPTSHNPKAEIRPYFVSESVGTTYLPFPSYTGNAGIVALYADVMAFLNGGHLVKIRFGRAPLDNARNAGSYAGGIEPTCGELTLRLADTRPPAQQEPGLLLLQSMYFNIIEAVWYDDFDGWFDNYPRNHVLRVAGFNDHDPNSAGMPKSDMEDFLTGYDDIMNQIITGGVIPQMENSARWMVQQEILDKGWGASAVWYNRIAEMNGLFSSAFLNVPVPSKFPIVMELVKDEKRLDKGGLQFETRFEPKKADGSPMNFKRPNQDIMAQAYWEAFKLWQDSGAMETAHTQSSGNFFKDILNALLGTQGLFTMRENPNVHPLAQLSGLGKSLIESSLRNLSNAAVGGIAAGILGNTANEAAAKTVTVASQALVSFGMISFSAGFVLFYIVPFLPFIYFMFALGGWVKGIFEAMVGAPLWALAHIRIDGNGLSGQAALAGYFLIFEIFLRPIMMIFGLIASVSIFSALVYVLNITFDLVVSNVGGFDVKTEVTGQTTAGVAVSSKIAEARGVVDEFFFTVLYAIIVYLIGMSSFKLIDLIPNNILRWMGQNVSTFNDSRENAAESLVGRAYTGTQQTSQSIGGGMKSMIGGMAKMGG